VGVYRVDSRPLVFESQKLSDERWPANKKQKKNMKTPTSRSNKKNAEMEGETQLGSICPHQTNRPRLLKLNNKKEKKNIDFFFYVVRGSST
jgi:protein-tyrosine phosphatase